MGGYIILEENVKGEEGSLDIEVLFNAVMQSREKIEAIIDRRVS
jgi:hypothetical protein